MGSDGNSGVVAIFIAPVEATGDPHLHRVPGGTTVKCTRVEASCERAAQGHKTRAIPHRGVARKAVTKGIKAGSLHALALRPQWRSGWLVAGSFQFLEELAKHHR